jgi:hypothetical protein
MSLGFRTLRPVVGATVAGRALSTGTSIRQGICCEPERCPAVAGLIVRGDLAAMSLATQCGRSLLGTRGIARGEPS